MDLLNLFYCWLYTWFLFVYKTKWWIYSMYPVESTVSNTDLVYTEDKLHISYYIYQTSCSLSLSGFWATAAWETSHLLTGRFKWIRSVCILLHAGVSDLESKSVQVHAGVRCCMIEYSCWLGELWTSVLPKILSSYLEICVGEFQIYACLVDTLELCMYRTPSAS